MKKNIKKLLPLLLIAAMISVFAVGCGMIPNNSDIAEAKTYVSISINPEVEFTVDENGLVVSVNTLNSDAEILLSDIDLTGMTIEAATEKFVELATEAGYIDVDSETNNVTITVIDENAETQETITNNMEERIYRFFDNNGIFGMVSKETLEAYAEQAAELNVSVGKMKMILRAIDLNPELTLEELAAMEMRDLVKLISKRHNQEKLGYTAREEFKTDLTALKAEFATMFALGEEIATLKEQLANFSGTEEEKAELEQTIAAKEDEHDALKVEFDARKETLITEAKELQSEIAAQRKAEREQRIEQHKEEIAAHKNQFNENREAKKNQIKEWREARQNNGK